LKGYWSDPPGFSFYTARLGVDGQPKTNQYGLQLLDCNRGTNDVENDHKQYVTTFGTWHTGIQMSDCLSAKAPTQSACRNDTDLAFLGSGIMIPGK
jgi:hypothetical protein